MLRAGNEGGADDELIAARLDQVDEASIAGGDLGGEAGDLTEDFVEGGGGVYDPADTLKQERLGA
jgi:hypothetical protein